MNEFIVWDEEKKEFYEYSNRFHAARADGVLIEDNLGFEEEDRERFTPYFYIGRKDINDKKIYAECSIVEFSYICCDEEFIIKGYFTWDEEYLKYIIDPIEGYENAIEYEPFKFINMRVIGTLQEKDK